MKTSNFRDYTNALAHLKTADEAAKRRISLKEDDDYVILNFGRPYKVDSVNKILQCKAWRRLKDKTQVFTKAVNAQIRTRLIHSLEITSFTYSICRILGLNDELCESGALLHDIGHVPFGHSGEKFISEITGKNFRHEVFSVLVAQIIERQGRGLNLTYQTLEAALLHSRGDKPLSLVANATPESTVVMYCDKIAYVLSDFNDIFCKDKSLDIKEFPEISHLANLLGPNQRARNARCLHNLCQESAEKGFVCFKDSEIAQIFERLRLLMYRLVYCRVGLFSYRSYLSEVYEFLTHPNVNLGADPILLLALMTDSDIFFLMENKYKKATDLARCSVGEIQKHLIGKQIDFTDPDFKKEDFIY